jgi:hypothetical protein
MGKLFDVQLVKKLQAINRKILGRIFFKLLVTVESNLLFWHFILKYYFIR